MAVATSSRKKRQTTAKKRKVSARPAAESKAYLNGNHYSKLSGMYLTSLDYTKAVSEWNAIPYLQTMYGAELCGYSMDPGDAPGNSTFVSKDSALTSGGGIWFPIYAQKGYAIDDEEAWTKTLSAINPDLKWLSGDSIAVGLKCEDRALGPNEKISISLKNGGSVDLLQNGDRSIRLDAGSFAISALLDGSNAISDWIDVSSELSIDSVRVLPKAELTPEEINYRNFTGSQHYLKHRAGQTEWWDQIGDLTKFVCGVSTDADVFVPTISDQPLKTPYLFDRMTLGIMEYYRKLGADVPDDYMMKFSSGKNAYDALKRDYPNIPFPDFQCENYETTITPLSSGWYKFYLYVDDLAFVFVDDKFVAFDVCGNKNMNEPPGSTGAPGNLSGWVRRLSTDVDCPYDLNQLNAAVGQFSQINTNRCAIPLTANTIASISARMLLSGNLQQTIGYNTITADTSQKYFYNNAWVADSFLISKNIYANENNLSLENNYYSSGGYVYMTAGNNYKFKVVHADITQAATTAIPPSYNFGGRYALKLLYEYRNDDRYDVPDLSCMIYNASNYDEHIGTWESLYLCADVFLSANKTTHYSNGTPIPGYERPRPQSWQNPYYDYRSDKYHHIIDFNTLISGVTWNGELLSNVLSAEQLEQFKNYKFIGGGAYLQHPIRLKYKTMQLFTTRDIELSSDIDDIYYNTYYQYLYGCWTSTTTLHNGIILERLPLCLKGPSSFS